MPGMFDEIQRAEAASETPVARRRQQSPPAGVLGLQRMAGNAAVGKLLQRETTKPRGKKGAKQPAKPKRKYHEISGNALEWDPPKLNGWAGDRAKEGNYLEAAAFYQYAYEKTQNQTRQYAWNTAKMFEKLPGYEEDKAYWLDVANGAKKHPLLPEFQHA